MNKHQYVCISGSRDGFTYEEFKEYMDKNFDSICWMMSGGARGIDTFAYIYALNKGIHFFEKKADWYNHGKCAGMIRNEAMANKIRKKNGKACVVAFCYSNSRGTTHMINYSKSIGLKVFEEHKNLVDNFNFDE